MRDDIPPTSGDSLTSRRLAFARIVATALSRYKSMPGGRRRSHQNFADAIGISRATLDRWLHCRWREDPAPANVDEFIRVSGMDRDDVYAALGWGYTAPQRQATPPTRDPRIPDLERLLEDPHVPESYREYVSTTLDILLRNRPDGE